MCSCSGNCNCNSTTIPRGPAGPQGPSGTAATITIGTVTTVPAGDDATVTNSGTPSAAIFNFEIPEGETGPPGPEGPILPGGKIISDVKPNTISNPAELSLLMLLSEATQLGHTFEVDLFFRCGINDLIIENVDTGVELFTISLPNDGSELQYDFGVKLYLTKTATNVLKGIYEVKGWAVNNELAFYTNSGITLSGLSFSTDQTFKFKFDPTDSGNSFRYGIAKFFSSAQEI